ncbi:hypothetical protein M0813_10246 [Anaeramoeba flamelloides]|uniref:Uncharacterized protein n=1 Tax=Anaeramoeba flamelloides TaxID=1746091 RepID=A0ABQ8X3F8_9EUKA|nr:hypothetical protein M0813_10246 [Anaeramoeba flamelloides]
MSSVIELIKELNDLPGEEIIQKLLSFEMWPFQKKDDLTIQLQDFTTISNKLKEYFFEKTDLGSLSVLSILGFLKSNKTKRRQLIDFLDFLNFRPENYSNDFLYSFLFPKPIEIFLACGDLEIGKKILDVLIINTDLIQYSNSNILSILLSNILSFCEIFPTKRFIQLARIDFNLKGDLELDKENNDLDYFQGKATGKERNLKKKKKDFSINYYHKTKETLCKFEINIEKYNWKKERFSNLFQKIYKENQINPTNEILPSIVMRILTIKSLYKNKNYFYHLFLYILGCLQSLIIYENKIYENNYLNNLFTFEPTIIDQLIEMIVTEKQINLQIKQLCINILSDLIKYQYNKKKTLKIENFLQKKIFWKQIIIPTLQLIKDDYTKIMKMDFMKCQNLLSIFKFLQYISSNEISSYYIMKYNIWGKYLKYMIQNWENYQLNIISYCFNIFNDLRSIRNDEREIGFFITFALSIFEKYFIIHNRKQLNNNTNNNPKNDLKRIKLNDSNYYNVKPNDNDGNNGGGSDGLIVKNNLIKPVIENNYTVQNETTKTLIKGILFGCLKSIKIIPKNKKIIQQLLQIFRIMYPNLECLQINTKHFRVIYQLLNRIFKNKHSSNKILRTLIPSYYFTLLNQYLPNHLIHLKLILKVVTSASRNTSLKKFIITNNLPNFIFKSIISKEMVFIMEKKSSLLVEICELFQIFLQRQVLQVNQNLFVVLKNYFQEIKIFAEQYQRTIIFEFNKTEKLNNESELQEILNRASNILKILFYILKGEKTKKIFIKSELIPHLNNYFFQLISIFPNFPKKIKDPFINLLNIFNLSEKK